MMRAEHLELVDARVLVAIALYRREHGEGPAWHVIAKAAGWRQPHELEDRLSRLRNTGLVRYTPEPRSIRLRDGALELALERLRLDQAVSQ
jgi:RIO-like serine/threonine protein kinase